MIRLKLSCTFLIVILGKGCFCDEKSPVVELATGKLQGEIKESREDRNFFAFRGIPYAKPPIGALRFEPPVPVEKWMGVKQVEEYEKQCVQYDTFEKKVKGQEDCLYLNVFTPKLPETTTAAIKRLFPVMVFIHGNNFRTGSASHYKPNYFMDEDVVIVTLNYRLGILGFLNTNDGLVRGNMGLKDQVLALKWVQDNVRKFNGDPKRVTLFGSGAGAASVHFHLLSPMSKGLFRKAISQSGSALTARSLQNDPRESALKLGLMLNCSEIISKSKPQKTNSTLPLKNATLTSTDVVAEPSCIDFAKNATYLLQCLRLSDAEKLEKFYSKEWEPEMDSMYHFVPTVEETHLNANDTFLSEHPYSLMIRGKQHKVPWILGMNSEEALSITGKILNDKSKMERFESNWNKLSPSFLLYSKLRFDITEKLRQFYFNNTTNSYMQKTENPVANSTTSTARSILASSVIQNQTLGYKYVNGTRSLQSSSTLAPTSTTVTSTTFNYTLDSPVEDDTLSIEDNWVEITKMFTDRLFLQPMEQALRIQSKWSPVYVYYNNYQGEVSFIDVYSGKVSELTNVKKSNALKTWFKSKILGKTALQHSKNMGVCHSDELLLLFKFPEYKIKEDSEDYVMSKDIVNLWVQFAYNENVMLFRNVSWQPVNPTSNRITALKFNTVTNQTSFVDLPGQNRLGFWKSMHFI